MLDSLRNQVQADRPVRLHLQDFLTPEQLETADLYVNRPGYQPHTCDTAGRPDPDSCLTCRNFGVYPGRGWVDVVSSNTGNHWRISMQVGGIKLVAYSGLGARAAGGWVYPGQRIGAWPLTYSFKTGWTVESAEQAIIGQILTMQYDEETALRVACVS